MDKQIQETVLRLILIGVILLVMIWALAFFSLHKDMRAMKGKIDMLQQDLTAQRRVISVQLEHKREMDEELANLLTAIQDAIGEERK